MYIKGNSSGVTLSLKLYFINIEFRIKKYFNIVIALQALALDKYYKSNSLLGSRIVMIMSMNNIIIFENVQ